MTKLKNILAVLGASFILQIVFLCFIEYKFGFNRYVMFMEKTFGISTIVSKIDKLAQKLLNK